MTAAVAGHSAHRSRKVRDWLAADPDGVELHFLPPHSPEPDPDELVNADLKHSLPKQHRARNQTELAAETRRFFRTRQSQHHIVRGCFDGPHVHYVLNGSSLSFRSSPYPKGKGFPRNPLSCAAEWATAARRPQKVRMPFSAAQTTSSRRRQVGVSRRFRLSRSASHCDVLLLDPRGHSHVI
ncbi:transposase [Streptomyces sp. HB2AG]|uniref:transposase n=1 Tax=Streptomyces sp. HB2AG TaxID=2983400 RepID=UPI003FA6AD97